jgi:hypothetical protein
MSEAPGPHDFPLPPLVVTAGGLIVEFGVVTAAAGIMTRVGDAPAPDIGVPTFILFILGAAITVTGASAFVMRWGTVHRVLAIGLGLVVGATALIAAVTIQITLGWILAIVGAALAVYGGIFTGMESEESWAARK